MNKKIKEHPLVKKLLSLNLPNDGYAIFGSGPMFAHGIKELRDIDLIVKLDTWNLLVKVGQIVETIGSSGEKYEKVLLFNGEIEAFKGWGPNRWDIDKLINEADVIDGVRFVKLEEVLKWKRMVNRPKDAEHIRMIEEYLAKNE